MHNHDESVTVYVPAHRNRAGSDITVRYEEHARRAGELGIKLLCAVIWSELLALESALRQYSGSTIAGSLLQRQEDQEEKPRLVSLPILTVCSTHTLCLLKYMLTPFLIIHSQKIIFECFSIAVNVLKYDRF